jgi:hypothetical protein
MDKREGKKGDSFAIDNLGESVHDARAAQILIASLLKVGEMVIVSEYISSRSA